MGGNYKQQECVRLMEIEKYTKITTEPFHIKELQE